MLTWVGHHQDDTVRAVLYNVGNDELKDVDISLHQVQPALSLLLASTSSHNHNLRVGSHTVVWNKHNQFFILFGQAHYIPFV